MSAVSLKARVRALESCSGKGIGIVVIPPGTPGDEYRTLVEAGRASIGENGKLIIVNRDGNGYRKP